MILKSAYWFDLALKIVLPFTEYFIIVYLVSTLSSGNCSGGNNNSSNNNSTNHGNSNSFSSSSSNSN